MAQQANTCAIKPDGLSLIVRTYMVEGEEPSPVNCPLTSTVVSMHPPQQIHVIKKKTEKNPKIPT